jgi:putative membrane protein
MLAGLVQFLISGILVMLGAYLVPGVRVNTYFDALLAALLIGVVNALIRPLLVLLTLPINILTLGLFTFVINAVLIMIVAAIVPGFSVDSFIAALLLGVVLSLFGALASML